MSNEITPMSVAIRNLATDQMNMQNLNATASDLWPGTRTVSSADWLRVSLPEQMKMHPFVQRVAREIRSDNQGRCPTMTLLNEVDRRLQALSSLEIGDINDPEARDLLAWASEMAEDIAVSKHVISLGHAAVYQNDVPMMMRRGGESPPSYWCGNDRWER